LLITLLLHTILQKLNMLMKGLLSTQLLPHKFQQATLLINEGGQMSAQLLTEIQTGTQLIHRPLIWHTGMFQSSLESLQTLYDFLHSSINKNHSGDEKTTLHDFLQRFSE
jgi:uncharacterized protein YfkK (UPF0435 family)